jgi:hypothetical protein
MGTMFSTVAQVRYIATSTPPYGNATRACKSA